MTKWTVYWIYVVAHTKHFLCVPRFLWVGSVSWLSWLFNLKLFCCIILFSEGTSTLDTHVFYILKLFISISWCLWVEWKKIREGERPLVWQRLGWREELSVVTQSLYLRDVYFPEISFAAVIKAPKHQQRHNSALTWLLCVILLF